MNSSEQAFVMVPSFFVLTYEKMLIMVISDQLMRNTGKIIWEYTNWQCGIPVPGAVDAGEGRILITGGYNAGAAMIKIEKKADGSSKLYLIEPDPSAFKPIATAELLKGVSGDQRFPTQNWAPLALSNGRLLIRDQSRLMCVKVAK